MRSFRTAVATALAAIGLMGAATADAQVAPATPVGAPCTTTVVPIGQGVGNPGTAPQQVCQGAGLTYIGPTIGQVGTIIGPTTIGPAVIGVSAVAAGNVGAL